MGRFDLGIDLSEDGLFEKAFKKTGLSDFGDDSFRTAMRVLLDADEQEASLSLVGRLMVRFDYLRILTNRLRIRAALKSTPGIWSVPIRRPIFIVGFPRTGTTLLHNLLAQDPETRVPLMWEVLWPAPSLNGRGDHRIRQARRAVQMTYALMPAMRSAHPVHETSPEECFFLLENEFACLEFEVRRHIPSYVSWLFNQGFVGVYQSYKQQLQLLQGQDSARRWALKSPFHLLSLDALLTVFPDACIVQTHRQPEEVVPSMCSVMSLVRKTLSRDVDVRKLGADWLDTWSEVMRRAMRARATADPKRFLDIDYRDLVSDPIAVVKRLYEHLGYPFTDECSDRMRAWLGKNASKKRPPHVYTLEQFGLTREAVNDRFAEYIGTYCSG